MKGACACICAGLQAMIQTNAQLIEALRSIIDLPKHIRSLDLRMRMDEAPTLTLETFVIGHDRLIQSKQTFKIEPDWLEMRANEASSEISGWFDDLRRRHASKEAWS